MRHIILGLALALATTFAVYADGDTNGDTNVLQMKKGSGINLASIEKMCVHKDRTSKWEDVFGVLSSLVHIPDVTGLIKEGEHVLCAYADRKTAGNGAGSGADTGATTADGS